jgi:hypothetical protein
MCQSRVNSTAPYMRSFHRLRYNLRASVRWNRFFPFLLPAAFILSHSVCFGLSNHALYPVIKTAAERAKTVLMKELLAAERGYDLS